MCDKLVKYHSLFYFLQKKEDYFGVFIGVLIYKEHREDKQHGVRIFIKSKIKSV
ncbi:hypothetical protein BML2496_28760 [Providencia rettgeri]|nr:hypothetical protein BML2496_28760 [Providencia rettgeri]